MRSKHSQANALELTIALTNNGRTRPLIDGTVSPEGIRLIPSVIQASEMVWRQICFAEFDVSEMSLSTYCIAVANGDTRWVGLPISIANLWFPHADIRVHKNAGITRPADLKGKRVGVPEYQQTPAMWARGALQHEFGVAPTDMVWLMERSAEMSHGGATGFQPPKGVNLTHIPTTTNLAEMLVRAEIDAILVWQSKGNFVDRGQINLATHSDIRRLFPDGEAESRRYYAKNKFYPMRRIVVVRRSILDQHPWVALNLYSAFVAAKELMKKQMREMMQPYFDLGLIEPSAAAVDPLAYGIQATRHILETAADYIYEQGLTNRLVRIEELFARCTLDL